MITFNNLVETYRFEEVYPVLSSMYQEGYSYAYNRAYQELIDTKPKYNLGVIHIEYVDAEDESYHDVYHMDQGERYAMDFVDWSEVLGMEVDIGNYTYEEALAHILWEITFYGYSNAEVQEEAAELDKVAKEAFND